MRRAPALAGLCVLWCATSVMAQPSSTPRQWPLNEQLIEISGLATASDNTVYAHNDEYAIVYEIDVTDGAIKRAFALGDPTARADFEGIAVYDERVYLITSDGLLYEADISAHRERARFNVYDTGVGAACEIEGLSLAPSPGDFFVLCKHPRKDSANDRLVIYGWNLKDRRPVSTPVLSIPYRDFLPISEREGFRPAGVEWDKATQTLMVISSRTHIVYSFTAEGAFKSKSRLSPALHGQSEGIAVLSSGDVLIADEGAVRKRAGLLSVYRKLP